jgi:hypothetical protein
VRHGCAGRRCEATCVYWEWPLRVFACVCECVCECLRVCVCEGVRAWPYLSGVKFGATLAATRCAGRRSEATCVYWE